MYFRILHDNTSGEFTYLLADPDTRDAVLIDPHGRDLPVLSALLSEHDLRLRWVLRTHHHDLLKPHEPKLLAELGAPLIHGAPDGTVLPFGDELVRVLATPGHTAACVSFAWRDRLFCGGLLAVDACPHQRRPAAPEALWDSVTRQVFALPNETLLFSGHEHRARGVSTVLEQRHWHPYFAGMTRDEFLTHMNTLPDRAVEVVTF
jgi:sulfur dioxygenase